MKKSYFISLGSNGESGGDAQERSGSHGSGGYRRDGEIAHV